MTRGKRMTPGTWHVKGTARSLRMAVCLTPLVVCPAVHAQSLESQLDEDQFLRGLVEYGVPEVLEHYLAAHPPDDPADALRYQVALEHMRVRDERLNDAEQLEAIESLLARRKELLDAHAGDSRHAVWLTDQAADLAFLLLPVDGAGLTAMYGLPSASQLERAQRVGREMYQLMSLAEIEIEQAILDMEARPGFSADIGLQLQRRRLSSEQRERRIPFFLGLGALMHARLNVKDVNEQRELLATAADALLRVAEVLDPPLATSARAQGGVAAAMLGESERASLAFDTVEQDMDATAIDRFVANIGRVMVRQHDAGMEAGLAALHELKPHYTAKDTIFLRMLIADFEHTCMRELAQARTGAERERMLAGSLGPYIELLDAELGVPRETVRHIVLARLARAIDSSVPIESLPSIAAIAQAEMLSQRDATRADGVARFRSLLTRSDLSASDRASVLDGLGRALLASGDRHGAASALLELAAAHAADPRAERAIELACSILADSVLSSPGQADMDQLLRDCLDVMLERYQNLATIDQWRYLAGRVSLAGNRFDEARRALESIPRDSEYYADAQFMRVQTTRTEAARDSDASVRERLSQQLVREVSEVEPILRGGPKRPRIGANESIGQLLAALAIFRAEALLELKRPEQAIESLAAVDESSGVSKATLADATRLRIRAFYESNQAEKVVAEIERLTQASPEEGGPMLAMLLESTQRTIEGLFDAQRDAEARAAAERELVPMAQALQQWLDVQGGEAADHSRLWFRVAEAYRLAGRFSEALPTYVVLLTENPDGLEASVGQAECLYALGRAADNNTEQLGEAMMVFRRIGAGSPDDIGSAWWLAQLRMLQILEATDRNTQQIVPRIMQLRQRDPDLGGDRFRQEFEALQNRNR